MPREQDLEGVVQEAFSRTREYVRQEVDIVPLTLWNESILRYYFCRSVANDDPQVKQFIECGGIDLVLSRGTSRAFIEFKFYRHPRRFDPYSEQMRGFKGGPGRKNLGEFQSCMALLHGPEQIADLPVPVAESPGAVRIGHPERSHLVEYLAPNSVFNSLPRQRSRPHLRPDDRLVTIDRVLHHASLGVA